MSAPPTPQDRVGSQPRMPLPNQNNAGGDMSMMFLVRPQLPRRFSSSERQQVKGLNFETIAAVRFPLPPWVNDSEYTALQPRVDSEHGDYGLFSLNFSLYGQTFNSSDWEDKWFFMYGRVHPYALTWEVEPEIDTLASDELQSYTVPALIVRDQACQPSVCQRQPHGMS